MMIRGQSFMSTYTRLTCSNHNNKWKCCQFLSMGTILVSLYTILFLHVNMSSTSFSRQQTTIRPLPITWLTEKQLNFINPNDSLLINRNDFQYILQPKQMCSSRKQKQQDKGLYFVIYVHSAPEHFQEREGIRATWGSIETIVTWSVRVIFLLGQTSEKIQRQIETENVLNDDIVQGNFVDSYRNLSYKHLMGYKWILSHCPDVMFIVKADDDAFMDVVQLYHLLGEMYGEKPKRLDVIACSVWSAGSSPQRLPNHKWTVSNDEYPFNIYPAYCGGLAYVVSPSAAKHLLAASTHVPFFWIDDLYVTGLLAEKVPTLQHHALNLRTTYDSQDLLNWLWEPIHRFDNKRCPYVFGEVNRSNNRFIFLQKLWNKTKLVWKDVDVVYRNR